MDASNRRARGNRHARRKVPQALLVIARLGCDRPHDVKVFCIAARTLETGVKLPKGDISFLRAAAAIATKRALTAPQMLRLCSIAQRAGVRL
jgi:hypothetical protein